ncbi:MAG TPA: hypothetical protein VMR45_01885 [Patescibacteria group bacterium]|nr:hypothetical protein [Patescibacteria group bacterium]
MYGFLDPSYVYGVQKAAEYGQQFGKEFISNYGPFAYSVVNILPENIYGSMLWNIAAVLFAGFGMYYFGKLYIRDKHLRIVAAILALLALSWAEPEWLYLDLFILYEFIYLKIPLKSVNKKRLLVALVAVSVLFMLTKFTIGLVSIGGLSIIVLTEKGQDSKNRVILLAKVLLGYSLALIALAYVMGTKDIIAYFTSGFEVANGFSGAMGINDPNLATATRYILALFLILIIWLVVKFKKDLGYYLFLFPTIFIIMKYCVTRQDNHVFAILYAVVFLCVIIYFAKPKIQAYDGIFVALILSCGALSFWTNYVDFRIFDTLLASPVINVREKQAVQFFRVNSQIKNWKVASKAMLKDAKLPESMRNKIGNEPVDIFPWETAIIEANGLKWHHRPSPYSFETYTKDLDDRNEAFIHSNGPKYIVWHRFGDKGVTGVDGRQLLWDGPETVQAVMQNYNFIEANDNFILLERRASPARITDHSSLGSGAGADWINVPQTSNLVCAQISIKSSLKQTLDKIILRERPYFVDVQYADGTIREYRFVRETSGGGLVINALPYDWEHLVELFKNKSLPSGDEVIKMRISNEPTAKVTFVPCGSSND